MNYPELEQVLSEVLNSKSSGTGNSFYNEECPRRQALNDMQPNAPSFEMQVGLIFHKLAELWRKGELTTLILPENDHADFDTDPVAEGYRLFKAYAGWYGVDSGVPQDFKLHYSEKPFPHTPEQAQALLAFWGVPFTFRPDACVQPLPPIRCRPLDISPDYRYYLDYKTSKRSNGDQVVKDAASTQFKAYIASQNFLVAQGLLDEPPVEGMIVDHIIRYKQDMMVMENGRPKGLQAEFVKPPTESEVEAIRRYYKFKAQYLKQDFCNLGACSWPRVCRHFTSGACNRISGTLVR